MYLANYATQSDLECYIDDRGDCETLGDIASPRGVILSSLENVSKVLQVAYDDWKDMHDDEDPMPNCEWVKASEFKPADGIYQTWELRRVGTRAELKGAPRIYGVLKIHPKEIY